MTSKNSNIKKKKSQLCQQIKDNDFISNFNYYTTLFNERVSRRYQLTQITITTQLAFS